MDLQDAFNRLDRLEADSSLMKSTVGDLRDALVVTAEIQRRQAAVQREQAERQVAQHEILDRHEEIIARLLATVDNLSDKLDGVIGYLDHLPRNPPQ